ncbi:hypothetical protein BDZ45DRAFT_607845, partial [Acephala macrosclerotiorum]
VKLEEVWKLTEELGTGFGECSAKENWGVNVALWELVRQIRAVWLKDTGGHKLKPWRCYPRTSNIHT